MNKGRLNFILFVVVAYALAIIIPACNSCGNNQYTREQKLKLPREIVVVRSIEMTPSGDGKYGFYISDGNDPRTGTAKQKTVYATANQRMERKLISEDIEILRGDTIIVIERNQRDRQLSDYEIIGIHLPYREIENVY